jgi:hypothetical protein
MKKQPLVIVLVLSLLCAAAAPPAAETAITSHIPRQTVRSSGLAAIGYSKRRHILELKFINGAVYRYLDVPPSVYRDLMSTESKTRYYDFYIKKNYRSVRVRPRVKEESAD